MACEWFDLNRGAESYVLINGDHWEAVNLSLRPRTHPKYTKSQQQGVIKNKLSLIIPCILMALGFYSLVKWWLFHEAAVSPSPYLTCHRPLNFSNTIGFIETSSGINVSLNQSLKSLKMRSIILFFQTLHLIGDICF